MPSPDYDVGPRFGLRALKGDSNVSDIDAGFFALRDDVENKMLGYSSGLHSARPAFGTAGRLYRETDTGLYFIDTGGAWLQIPVAAIDGAMRGATNIATSESRSNTAYGTLTTPDQATVVLPTNGQLVVGYQATWQETVAGAARAAIFLNGNQVQISSGGGTQVTQACATGADQAGADSTVNRNHLMTTGSFGLVCGNSGGYPGDVSTGQILGMAHFGSSASQLFAEIGGNVIRTSVGAAGTPPTGQGAAGPCVISAAAGTYAVSVQFKASSGTVTASNRKLWVEAKSFG